MASAETIHRARRNGMSAGQEVALGEKPVQVDEVIDLLEGASETAHIGVRMANSLLEAMDQYGPWRITAGRHRGGAGDRTRRPDDNLHITVSAGGIGYHLHLTRQNQLRRITGAKGMELVPPWLPPGARVPR